VPLNKWDIAFWVAGLVGNIGLCAILIGRKRAKTFPWFTILIAQDTLQSVLLFLLHSYGSRATYFYSYWSFEVLDAVLRILVIWDLSRQTTKQLQVREGLRTFLSLVLAFLVIAGVSIWRDTPNLSSLLETIALKTSLFTAILVGGLVLYHFTGWVFYGVRLRVHSMGLSFGLCGYYAAKLIMHFILLMGGSPFWMSLERLLKPVYLLCLAFWMVLLWMDEPTRVVSKEMERMLFFEPVKLGASFGSVAK
jgi:hypothetical protein